MKTKNFTASSSLETARIQVKHAFEQSNSNDFLDKKAIKLTLELHPPIETVELMNLFDIKEAENQVLDQIGTRSEWNYQRLRNQEKKQGNAIMIKERAKQRINSVISHLCK